MFQSLRQSNFGGCRPKYSTLHLPNKEMIQKQGTYSIWHHGLTCVEEGFLQALASESRRKSSFYKRFVKLGVLSKVDVWWKNESRETPTTYRLLNKPMFGGLNPSIRSHMSSVLKQVKQGWNKQ